MNQLQIDTRTLRGLLRTLVGDMKGHCTGDTLPDFCAELGLPARNDGGSKRERLQAAVDAISDDSVPSLARTLLNKRLLDPRTRNQVQDLLWVPEPAITVPKRYRRDLAQALQGQTLFRHWENFVELIQDIFIVDAPLFPLLGQEVGVIAEIHRHFIRFPEDSNIEWLFERLGVADLSDRRFAHFIEGLVSGDVQLDLRAQRDLVAIMNDTLRDCGVELRQMGEADGYPRFLVVMRRNVRGQAKNLIFASHTKPDIRIHDAVNNDIEILSNLEDVLVYDKPIGSDGLRWQDLQTWWSETRQETDPEVARQNLFQRLCSCLPASSPPQKLFFRSFFQIYRNAVRTLPALIPEVWLHWDPKTIAARGPQALLNHRMDFLMLLPRGARVVIEIDGVQHYAGPAGRADPRVYARTVAGDRDLRLAGYEVYRFAGVELQETDGIEVVKSFFDALFKQHGVVPQ